MKKSFLSVGVVVVSVLIVGVIWLNRDISQKQKESTQGIVSKEFVEMSDENPTFDSWGRNFPDHLDMYLKVQNDKPMNTDFGGNLAYSKLVRYPQLTILWAGYAFSLDTNEERGHFFMQIDQMETGRNHKDFLNAHGLTKFNGQPAACMNCHSGWTPWLIKHAAKGDFAVFNSTKYWTMLKSIPAVNGIQEGSVEHAGPHGGKRMGLTCADCHAPNTMELRITRPAAINALVARGYERDPNQGIKASREEMRTLVCSQCHVEYYFRPTGKKVKVIGETIALDQTKKWHNGAQKTYDEFEFWRDGNRAREIEVDGINLTFPWKEWKKNKPFRIEMFDDYYDANLEVFKQDFRHKLTGAPILKIQHPESELYSGGVHSANGVSCADCHMPYIRKGARKVTDHNIVSPLQNINAACKSCHTQSEEYLKKQIKDIQYSVAYDLRTAEYALVSLIFDIKEMRDRLGKMASFQTNGKKDETKIDLELKEILDLHRKSQMRVDFMGAENSTGFHNPREGSRMLLQAVEMAHMGQTKLVVIAAKYGMKDFSVSHLGFKDIQKFNPGEITYKVNVGAHKKGERYYEDKNVNGSAPIELLRLDEAISTPFSYRTLD